MKKILLCILFLSQSCNYNTRPLPKATGSSNEIIIISESTLWESKQADILRNIFTEDIIGISQSEKLFNLIHVTPADFKSIFKTHKNIIILSDEGDCQINKNKWAENQLVFKVNLQKPPDQLENEFIKAIDFFTKKEITDIRIKIKKTVNKKAIEAAKNQFNIDLLIPNDYTLIKDSANFIWASYNPPKKEEIKQLLVYSFTPQSPNYNEEAILKTNEFFARYLKGNLNSFVLIEEKFPLHCSSFYCRGLWRLSEGFMGGPFLQKIIMQKDGKIIVLVGLIFAPQSNKRSYIKELEAIFY